MYEFLKALFGTNEDGTPVALTFDQLSERLAVSKEVKLANLAEGGYVSRDKYDAKETELSGVRDQLTAANQTIQSYKDMDIEGIKQSAADWEQKAKNASADLEQKLAEKAREYGKELFFRGYKFSSKAAESGIRAEFDKMDFKLDGDTFLGASEWMEKLKTSDDNKGAFAVEEPAAPPADDDGKGGTNPPKWSSSKQDPPAPPKKKSLLELMKEKNDNPDADITFN